MGGAITAADLLFNRSRGVGGFGYSLIERALIAARALWFYVGKLFWPLDLAGIYPHWEVREADPLSWVGVGASLRVGGGALATASENRARAAGRSCCSLPSRWHPYWDSWISTTCCFPSLQTATSI